jgi:hypothetical protein
MKQLSLFQNNKRIKIHGGSLNFEKRKTKRPLQSGKVIHLVLKSEGHVSLFANRSFILKTIEKQAQLSGIKLYGVSVQRDHIHHAVLFSDSNIYCRYIRSVTGLLSRRFGAGMWKYQPYTRIVEWGKDFKGLKSYIVQNEDEVWGRKVYKSRGKSG